MATQTTQRTTQTFFNLPQAAVPDTQQAYFGTPQKHTIQTNWYTFEDQPLSLQTFTDVLADRIPVVREKGFLTPDERQRMLEVVKTHNIVSVSHIQAVNDWVLTRNSRELTMRSSHGRV
jgi:hypothetical protein